MGTVLSSVKYTPDGVPYHGLNDFKDLQRLDSGGYGIVYKGYDVTRLTKKKRMVAVKVFNQLDVYAEREIEILKTHSHPHIVELFGVIWDGATKDIDGTTKMPLYSGYVMEYLELGSLHNEIHDVSKQYDMKLIVLWIEQIGSGLQYLHEHEILHRDVKPRNILLATRTHLKLADFGLARNVSVRNTYTSGLRGTDPYMAPEIVGTEKNYGPSADVYSFGVTIWEIICRKHPSKHLQVGNDGIELPIDPDKMSEDSWNFVKRCWQREISDRPSVEEISAFATFEQTILVVGEDSNKNKMTIWNRKASTWTVSRMELPGYIVSVGVVYLDDELYIINYDKSLFKLDKNMEWKRLADMNEERGHINNTCLGWNGYIWVFGGWNMDRDEELKSVKRYDPKRNRWTRMPDMKYARCWAAAAVCNRKIYICGGIGDDDDVGLKSVECFDPESGVWTELTDMPTPRKWHSLVCYRNKLVVIGGWDEKYMTTTVLELDPLEKNGQWKELSPLTYHCCEVVGVVLGREIFAIGWDNTNDRSTSVHIFNGINWRVGPSFPLALEYYPSPSAVLVPQQFADRLSSYPVDLKQ